MLRCAHVAPRARRIGFAAHVRMESADVSADGGYESAAGSGTDADDGYGSRFVPASEPFTVSSPSIVGLRPARAGGLKVKAHFPTRDGEDAGMLIWQKANGETRDRNDKPIQVSIGTKMATVKFGDGCKEDVLSNKQGTLAKWLKFVGGEDDAGTVKNGEGIAELNP